MRVFFSILICGISLLAGAQTKKIAFRSHGGNSNFFQLAVENGSGDTENSNFGMAPDPIVRMAQLDSVILLCDTAAVMVTSEYCRNRRSKKDEESRWKAGKDTVYRHELFNSQLPLDSIRKILGTQYHFRNSPDKIVFIGFEHPITMNNQRNESLSPVYKNNDQVRFGNQYVLITGLIIGLSLLGGLTAWKIAGSGVSPTIE